MTIEEIYTSYYSKRQDTTLMLYPMSFSSVNSNLYPIAFINIQWNDINARLSFFAYEQYQALVNGDLLRFERAAREIDILLTEEWNRINNRMDILARESTDLSRPENQIFLRKAISAYTKYKEVYVVNDTQLHAELHTIRQALLNKRNSIFERIDKLNAEMMKSLDNLSMLPQRVVRNNEVIIFKDLIQMDNIKIAFNMLFDVFVERVIYEASVISKLKHGKNISSERDSDLLDKEILVDNISSKRNASLLNGDIQVEDISARTRSIDVFNELSLVEDISAKNRDIEILDSPKQVENISAKNRDMVVFDELNEFNKDTKIVSIDDKVITREKVEHEFEKNHDTINVSKETKSVEIIGETGDLLKETKLVEIIEETFETAKTIKDVDIHSEHHPCTKTMYEVQDIFETVLKTVKRRAPHLSISYFKDVDKVPYDIILNEFYWFLRDLRNIDKIRFELEFDRIALDMIKDNPIWLDLKAEDIDVISKVLAYDSILRTIITNNIGIGVDIDAKQLNLESIDFIEHMQKESFLQVNDKMAAESRSLDIKIDYDTVLIDPSQFELYHHYTLIDVPNKQQFIHLVDPLFAGKNVGYNCIVFGESIPGKPLPPQQQSMKHAYYMFKTEKENLFVDTGIKIPYNRADVLATIYNEYKLVSYEVRENYIHDLDFFRTIDKAASLLTESKNMNSKLKIIHSPEHPVFDKPKIIHIDEKQWLEKLKSIHLNEKEWLEKIKPVLLPESVLHEKYKDVIINTDEPQLILNKTIELLHEFIYQEMYRRWYYLPDDGPHDLVILPLDYPYETKPVNDLYKHPFPGKDIGTIEVPVDLQVMSNFIDFCYELWNSHVELYSRYTAEQALKHFVNLIYDWITKYIPDIVIKPPEYYGEDYEVYENINRNRQDYARLYRWVRWYAEALIMNIPEEDKRPPLTIPGHCSKPFLGNEYIRKLLRDMVKYFNDHHGIYGYWIPGLPQEHKTFDKIKGVRHKWLDKWRNKLI